MCICYELSANLSEVTLRHPKSKFADPGRRLNFGQKKLSQVSQKKGLPSGMKKSLDFGHPKLSLKMKHFSKIMFRLRTTKAHFGRPKFKKMKKKKKRFFYYFFILI